MKKETNHTFIDVRFNKLKIIKKYIFGFYYKISINGNKPEIWSAFKLSKLFNEENDAWREIK